MCVSRGTIEDARAAAAARHATTMPGLAAVLDVMHTDLANLADFTDFAHAFRAHMHHPVFVQR